MSTFLEACLLAVFVVPLVLDRRARRGRRVDPAKMPAADRPPVHPTSRVPRWNRRRYVQTGVLDAVAYLSEQDASR